MQKTVLLAKNGVRKIIGSAYTVQLGYPKVLSAAFVVVIAVIETMQT